MAEKILTFVAKTEPSEAYQRLLTYLEEKKAAGIIRSVDLHPPHEDEDEEPEYTPEDAIECAESALATLSEEEWVRNVFGDEVTDVSDVLLQVLEDENLPALSDTNSRSVIE